MKAGGGGHRAGTEAGELSRFPGAPLPQAHFTLSLRGGAWELAPMWAGGTGQSRGRDQGVPTEALAGVAVPSLGTRSGGGGLPGIPKEGPFSP